MKNIQYTVPPQNRTQWLKISLALIQDGIAVRVGGGGGGGDMCQGKFYCAEKMGCELLAGGTHPSCGGG